ncbi:Uncharacterised protein [BD1-7 clade bacterium]|uniref:Universal stress protein n=1 Tax=BD1-7 clade bacterium TaxID=2029982 RepID=A0A5S9QPT4_9GAMM|nr:Uncharacterised protein [BD1-7 clade bacterium]
MQIVLAAVDFESMEASKTVIEKARAFAHPADAELHLIHVAPPVTSSYTAALTLGILGDELKEITNQNETAARKLLLELGGDDILTENCHVVIGNPANRLYAVAHRIGADIVIIGNNHHSGMHVGSVAHKLVHLAKFDLYIVNTHSEKD